MEFIYADELKKQFEVLGHFYDVCIGEQVFKCRSLLEIVELGRYQPDAIPDAVVVMMNPGSSVPLDRKYSPELFSINEMFSSTWKKEIIPARPDNAQYQIMRLMLLNNWRYVKILNLSDLRNGNSGKFSKEFQAASTKDSSNPHCITHTSRRKELTCALRTKSDGPVIAAWGSVEVLKESAFAMIALQPDVVGLKRDQPWYRYASPYKKDHKLEWLTKMDAKVKKKSG